MAPGGGCRQGDPNIKPRVQGAWNLHEALSGSGLDFFVVMLSGIIGNLGQSAYAASNAFLDSFAAYRNRLGLAPSIINIGVVDTVGIAAAMMKTTLAIAVSV